jgi:hypothetical protein
MEVASVGGTSDGQSKGGQNNLLDGLGSLLGGFSGGNGKGKSKGSQNNILGSLASLFRGKKGTSRSTEFGIATAWLENYLRHLNPGTVEDSTSFEDDSLGKMDYSPTSVSETNAASYHENAADTRQRSIEMQPDAKAAAPPPSTETNAPRSAAMGSRTSFRVSMTSLLGQGHQIIVRRVSRFPCHRRTGFRNCNRYGPT